MEGSEPHRAVGRQFVRVDQRLRRAFEALLHVDHALVLQPVVLRVEEVRTAPERCAVLRIVVELLQPLLHLRPERDLFEIAERHLVLGGHPRGGLRRTVVLEPPVRVGHLGAVIVVHLVTLAGIGIRQRLRRDAHAAAVSVPARLGRVHRLRQCADDNGLVRRARPGGVRRLGRRTDGDGLAGPVRFGLLIRLCHEGYGSCQRPGGRGQPDDSTQKVSHDERLPYG